jgi:hypothetical protein
MRRPVPSIQLPKDGADSGAAPVHAAVPPDAEVTDGDVKSWDSALCIQR